MMKNIAVVLSGCGVFDGSEIHESVLALLAIERNGGRYQCFAPDIMQRHVINHLTGDVCPNEKRNVLVEAARIARGKIKALTELDVNDFDALILPGGSGAAKNLCNFADMGSDCTLNDELLQVCRAFAETGKVAGFICISPVMLPKIYGQGVMVTIGNDAKTAAAIEAMGGKHHPCQVNEVVVDLKNKVVSTPAYMLAGSISKAAQGINKLVDEVFRLAQN